MKLLFWIAAVITAIGDLYLIRGYIDIYYNNYNGGPESSSGSIKYVMFAGLAILFAGLITYFTGHLKVATLIMTAPIALLILYMFILLLPALFGARMN